MNVTNGPNVVSLVINFPAHYPNNAIPSFEFTPDTSIDVNTKTKLMKVSLSQIISPLKKVLKKLLEVSLKSFKAQTFRA